MKKILVLALIIAIALCSSCPQGYVRIDAETCISSLNEAVPGCKYHAERQPAKCQVCEDGYFVFLGFCSCPGGKYLVQDNQGNLSCQHAGTNPVGFCQGYSKENIDTKCYQCRAGYYKQTENGVDSCVRGQISACEYYKNENTCSYCDSRLGAGTSSEYFYISNKCKMVRTIPDCYKYNENNTCSQKYDTTYLSINNQCGQGEVYINKENKCVKGEPIYMCKSYDSINVCGECGQGLGFMQGQTNQFGIASGPGTCSIPSNKKVQGCKVHAYGPIYGPHQCVDNKGKDPTWRQGEESQPKNLQNTMKTSQGTLLPNGFVLLTIFVLVTLF